MRLGGARDGLLGDSLATEGYWAREFGRLRLEKPVRLPCRGNVAMDGAAPVQLTAMRFEIVPMSPAAVPTVATSTATRGW